MVNPQHILLKPRQVKVAAVNNNRLDAPKADVAPVEATELVFQDTPMSLKIKEALWQSNDGKSQNFLSGHTKYLFDIDSGRPARILIGSTSVDKHYHVELKVMDAVSKALNPEYKPLPVTEGLASKSVEPIVGLKEYNLAKNIVAEEVNEEALPEPIVKNFDLPVEKEADTSLFTVDDKVIDKGGLFGYSHELPKLHRLTTTASTTDDVVDIDDALEEDEDEDNINQHSKRAKVVKSEKKIDNELERMASQFK